MFSGARREAVLPALLMGGGALLGGGIGLLAYPEATFVVLAATLVQLAASALAWRMASRPVLIAAVIALVTLGLAVEPTLRELLRQGAFLWITVAHVLGTLNLVRRARSRTELILGVVLLILAAAGVGVTSVLGGVPVAPSVLASTVPMLGGALIATVQQLNLARQDRLTQRTVTAGAIGGGDQGAARQALLLVALRADTMLSAARDDDSAAQARDLRTVALQGLTVPHAASQAKLIVRVGSGPVDETATPDEVPAGERVEPPPLSEREREIVRLLVTGASNALIARELYLSEATVKGHVSRLMRRFNRDNRTQLALLAAGWFD